MSPLDHALGLVAEGLPCFFCRADKTPACPHGFHDAICDPTRLRDLHRRYPGPLVAVATGEAARTDVLDLDKKHVEAVEWWRANRDRLPRTRSHRTKSGGIHLVFRHHAGLRCWTARPVIGVDGRSTGGYVIWWPAVGLPVLCDAAPAPWPEWLLSVIAPAAPAQVSAGSQMSPDVPDRYVGAALRNAIDRISRADEGARNATLNSEAHGLARFVIEGLLGAQEVADALASAAIGAGLHPRETILTLRSAFRARGLA